MRNCHDCHAVWRAVSMQGYYTDGLENIFCVSGYHFFINHVKNIFYTIFWVVLLAVDVFKVKEN